MAEKKLSVCDLCELNPADSPPGLEDRVSVETVELRFKSGGRQKVDLCPTHLAALLQLVPVGKMQRSLNGGELVCPLCDRRYGSRNGLAYHMEAEHGDKEKARRIAGKGAQLPRNESVSCVHCGQLCKSPQGLASHIRVKHPEAADGKGQAPRRRRSSGKKGKAGTRQAR